MNRLGIECRCADCIGVAREHLLAATRVLEVGPVTPESSEQLDLSRLWTQVADAHRAPNESTR